MTKRQLKRVMSRARNQILTPATWAQGTYWTRRRTAKVPKPLTSRADVTRCCAMGAIALATCELGLAPDAHAALYEVELAMEEHMGYVTAGDLVTFNDKYALNVTSVKNRIKELEDQLA